jgi:hypothetical protein
MISIKKTPGWESMEKIFRYEWRKRLDWFFYEFSKQATFIFHEKLLGSLEDVVGVDDYKERLVVAELRQGKKKSWFAIAALAEGGANFNGKTTILNVVPRFSLEKDAVKEILYSYGPWTIDTIPFVPSIRQAAVTITEADEKDVIALAERNIANGSIVNELMLKYNLSFEPRFVVWKKLRVIPDWRVEAIKIEYGLTDNSRPHWRPSLRWLEKTGIKELQKIKPLNRVWFDPNFSGFKKFQKIQEKFTESDLKEIQEFQDKIRKR